MINPLDFFRWRWRKMQQAAAEAAHSDFDFDSEPTAPRATRRHGKPSLLNLLIGLVVIALVSFLLVKKCGKDEQVTQVPPPFKQAAQQQAGGSQAAAPAPVPVAVASSRAPTATSLEVATKFSLEPSGFSAPGITDSVWVLHNARQLPITVVEEKAVVAKWVFPCSSFDPGATVRLVLERAGQEVETVSVQLVCYGRYPDVIVAHRFALDQAGEYELKVVSDHGIVPRSTGTLRKDTKEMG